MKAHFIYISIALVLLTSCKLTSDVGTGSNELVQDKQEWKSEQELLTFKNWFFEGNKEKMLGNHEKAAEYFKKCIKINPNGSASYFELSLIRDFQKNTYEATRLLEKAIELYPNNKWYLITLADFNKSARKHEGAITAYENLIEIEPNSIEFKYELASAYILNNDLKGALKVYDEIEDKYGVTEEVSIQKQKIHLNLKNPDDAVLEIEKLIKKYPGNTKHLNILADIFLKQNKTDKALTTYKKIEEVEPNNPFVQLSLADFYMSANKMDSSKSMLLKAFKNTKLDIDTKIKILYGEYSRTLSDSTGVAFDYRLSKIITQVHSHEAKGYAIYGDFLYRSSAFVEAKEEYRKAIELDKSKFIIWNQLLTLESELNDFKSMKSESAEAIELFPLQPAFYFFNGMANYQLKSYEDAINSFEAGKEMVFDNKPLKVQFYANLADVYYQLNKFQEAFKNYDAALVEDPNNAYVLNNFSYYLSLQKQDLEKALKMSALSNELLPKNASYLDTYAWIYYQMKDYENAKTQMENAIKCSKREAPTLIEHYGDILFRLGEKELAKDQWKIAIEKGGDSEELKTKVETGTLKDES